MKVRILQLPIILLIFSTYGCYKCEEAENFFNSAVNIALVDADTKTVLPEHPNDIIIFRNGEPDSTMIDMKSNWRIRIDEWEINNFRTSNGILKMDTTFNLEYHLHFVTDTISGNLLNIDTINIDYSIKDTDCNVIDIDEIEVRYNNEIFPIGGYPFYTIRI